MFHILSFYYMDISVGSFHIFKPFLVPREQAAIFWKVSSKNLSPITKPQYLRGVKTNPIKFLLGLAGGTRLFSSNAIASWGYSELFTCCQPLVWGHFQPQPPTSEPSSPAACRAQQGLCVLCLASNNPQTMTEKLQWNTQMEDPQAKEAKLTWLTESQWKFWGIS